MRFRLFNHMRSQNVRVFFASLLVFCLMAMPTIQLAAATRIGESRLKPEVERKTSEVNNSTSETNASVDPLGVACVMNPVVTKIADTNDGVCDADCSLREAIAQACPSSIITFNTAGVFATPQTITLALGELSVASDVTIDAPDSATQRITVTGNNASRVFNINSGKLITIRDLTLTGGLAAGDFGGAIYNNHATLTLIGVTVSGNTASSGGAIYNDGGAPNGIGAATLTIVNSTISGNTANLNGGGIYNTSAGGNLNGATLNLTNSTVSGNTTALFGGGVFSEGVLGITPINITNCTITDNRADGAGGGGLNSGAGTTATLRNSIVDLNFVVGGGTTANDIRGPVVAGGVSTHNLIGSCTSCGLTNGVDNNSLNVPAASLNIGPLAANGAINQTHALLPGSIAIETGNNTYVVAPPFLNTAPITDERGTGFPRIADSADAGTTATVDIGAFELQPTVEDITEKTTAEDTPFNFNFNLGDDTGALIASVTATSSNTTLVQNANLIVTGSGGSRNLAITPALNANSPADGTATITVTVTATNGLTATDTFVLTVTEVNDNPDAVNDSLTPIDEDSITRVIPFADLLVNDAKGPANESGQTITVTNVSNPIGGTVVINGTNVEFTPTANFNGAASFDYTITDNGTTNAVLDPKSDTATASFTVSGVNDPPSFTKGGDQTVNEDAGAQTVVGWATGISAGPGETQTLTFNVSVTGTTGNLSFSTAPAINATTGTLTYTTAADTNGTANLSVTLSDNGSNTPPNSNTSAAQTFIITVNAVNDAPTFQLGANPSVGEDAGPQTVNGFAFNFQPGPVTATDEAGQTLVGYTLSQTGSTGGLTFSAAPTIDTSGNLTFTASAGLSGTATFNVVATDSGSGTPPNVNQSAPVSFTITVNAVNDPPVNTVPGSQGTNQNTPLVFSSGNGNQVSIADPDAGANTVEVTLTVTNGTLTLNTIVGLTFTSGDGTNDATMTFRGTIANINTALNGMSFAPTIGFSGPATLTITTDDLGNTGSGGAQTDTDIVNIQVATNISIQDAQVGEPSSGSVNMIFTVVLSAPAPAGGVSVNFTTQDEPAGPGKAVAGQDYSTTSGTVNFAPGEQIKTIAVPVLADGDVEPNETFLVQLSSPTNATIADGTATGTIVFADLPGTVLISELRTSGPAGAGDDFVEIYNNSNAPITIAASDASGGYGLYKMGADCSATPVLIGVIPNGTIIPARGHYLFVGSAYSLANYGGPGAAAGDQTLFFDIESDRNVALFTTATVANISSGNRLDAVGFGANTGGVCDLLREGTTLSPLVGSVLDYSFFRDECGKKGDPMVFGSCPTGGFVKDSNVNSDDFIFADTVGALTVAGQRLGAPGPQNLGSPRQSNSTVPALLIDSTVPAAAAPNRFRDLAAVQPNAANGTLALRRRFVNNSGAPVTRLRFRIMDISAFVPPGPVADVRALTSGAVVVSGVADSVTCLAANGVATTPCSITVQGTTLETPPAQPLGGGLNSSMSVGTITLATPLAPGASINLQFLLGVQQPGAFKFVINMEALTGAPPVPLAPIIKTSVTKSKAP